VHGPRRGHRETNAVFYDPVLGVHFIHTANDNVDDGRIWVYRHSSAGGDSTAPAAPTGLAVN
jgi:hypothetical protein